MKNKPLKPKIHVCYDCGKKSEVYCTENLLPNTPCIKCQLKRLGRK